MKKIIKLTRKSIKNNRVYKIMGDLGIISNKSNYQLGLFEYKKNGDQNFFLNISRFVNDFFRGSAVTKKLLSNLKHSGLLKSPWRLG